MAKRKNSIEFAKGLPLPVTAVTETFGFIGRRGSGKTYAAGKLVEGMLDVGAQVVVLDPIGLWYGLRAGSHPYDIPVLGGEHGDIPLEHTAGAMIADVVVDKDTSAVLDLSGFSKAKRKTFVADFAERLFHRKKTARSPLHIVLEEAQVFAPQRADRGGERMLGAIEDIVRLGRNYGLGASLISQRPQSVNKEVLNQTEALVVLQTNGKHERKAIQDWVVHQGIDTHAMVDELPSLPVGTAFLWSPQWLGKLEKVRILKKRSADTSATPKVGQRRRSTKPSTLSSSELKKLQEAMTSATSDDASGFGNSASMNYLKRRVKALEKQIAEQKVETKTVEVPVLSDNERELVIQLIDSMKEWTRGVNEVAADLSKALQKADSTTEPQVEQANPSALQRATTKFIKEKKQKKALRPPCEGPKLRAGAMRMLQGLADHFPAGLTKRQVAGAAKMKSTGGTFNTYWGELRKGGYITKTVAGAWATWVITSEGFALLGQEPAKHAPTLNHRVDYWSKRLRSGARRILGVLYTRHMAGKPAISKAGLAFEVSMAASGGTFNTYLGVLRVNRLVQRDSDDNYELSDWIRGKEV